MMGKIKETGLEEQEKAFRNDEKIDITCNNDNHKVLRSPQEMRFLEVFKAVKNGDEVSMCGTHFNAEEMANLLGEAVFTIQRLKLEGNMERRLHFEDWIIKSLMTRRQMRYYNECVYEYKSELKF